MRRRHRLEMLRAAAAGAVAVSALSDAAAEPLRRYALADPVDRAGRRGPGRLRRPGRAPARADAALPGLARRSAQARGAPGRRRSRAFASATAPRGWCSRVTPGGSRAPGSNASDPTTTAELAAAYRARLRDRAALRRRGVRARAGRVARRRHAGGRRALGRLPGDRRRRPRSGACSSPATPAISPARSARRWSSPPTRRPRSAAARTPGAGTGTLSWSATRRSTRTRSAERAAARSRTGCPAPTVRSTSSPASAATARERSRSTADPRQARWAWPRGPRPRAASSEPAGAPAERRAAVDLGRVGHLERRPAARPQHAAHLADVAEGDRRVGEVLEDDVREAAVGAAVGDRAQRAPVAEHPVDVRQPGLCSRASASIRGETSSARTDAPRAASGRVRRPIPQPISTSSSSGPDRQVEQPEDLRDQLARRRARRPRRPGRSTPGGCRRSSRGPRRRARPRTHASRSRGSQYRAPLACLRRGRRERHRPRAQRRRDPRRDARRAGRPGGGLRVRGDRGRRRLHGRDRGGGRGGADGRPGGARGRGRAGPGAQRRARRLPPAGRSRSPTPTAFRRPAGSRPGSRRSRPRTSSRAPCTPTRAPLRGPSTAPSGWWGRRGCTSARASSATASCSTASAGSRTGSAPASASRWPRMPGSAGAPAGPAPGRRSRRPRWSTTRSSSGARPGSWPSARGSSTSRRSPAGCRSCAAARSSAACSCRAARRRSTRRWPPRRSALRCARAGRSSRRCPGPGWSAPRHGAGVAGRHR